MQRSQPPAIRYAFDDENRLVTNEPLDPAEQLRPLRVVEGTVATDRHNRLVYEAASAVGPEPPGQRRFLLDGTWRLTRDHRLALTLHETERRQRQTLFLKGAVAAAEANVLAFALRRREDEARRTAQRLTLTGRWQADAQNRLSFLVEKADGSEDRLTLQGGWGIGPRHELLYRHRQRVGGQRRTEEHALIFDGAWDITTADRLVYRLTGSADSVFEFRASLQSPSLLAREGRIVYQVGIGLSGGQVRRERVTLFGAWKLHRDLSVSFEIPYGDGRVQALRFEGSARLSPRDRVAVALRNSRREGLGLTVTFTRELVPDADLFLRLRKDAAERSAIGGVHVKF